MKRSGRGEEEVEGTREEEGEVGTEGGDLGGSAEERVRQQAYVKTHQIVRFKHKERT